MVHQADRLYTAEQVRRLDHCAIHEHGIPGMDLMERAGRRVFETARSTWPEARRWVVLCGAGNNGGDGYVVARLAREAGLGVSLLALKPADSLRGDAATAARRWQEAGGATMPWAEDSMADCDLAVDALLGTGLDREPAGDFAAAIDAINALPCPVVAVDIPSGLHADTGVVQARAVRADLTVTFIGNKRGLFTADGPDCAGTVTFTTLETPDSVRDSQQDCGILIHEDIIRDLLRPRDRNTHKGSYGWLLGVGSDLGMSGAIRLCGEAALRAGAGKVTLVTRPEQAGLVNLTCPELMVRGLDQGKALADLIYEVTAVVAGTGLGQSAWSWEMFDACMNATVPMVLDADGLNLLAQRSGSKPPSGQWILTPHPAEAGRLLGCPAAEVQQDRIAAAQELARAFDAVVVLKGCGTVVADAAGRYGVCPLGNPGMATAGSGDVLSGVLGAMLAQGLDCWHAACAGVVAHARAGDLAAGQWGERGLMASDLTHQLPAVVNPRPRPA
jgi:NAD(P)H-hydrate epimerase